MDHRFMAKKGSYRGVDATSDCHLAGQRGGCGTSARRTSSTLSTEAEHKQPTVLAHCARHPARKNQRTQQPALRSLAHPSRILVFLLLVAAALRLRRISAPVMVRAVVWSPVLQSCYGVCSRTWMSEVSCSRQDFFSGKGDLRVKNLVPIRSPPVGSAAIRSSSEASTDFQGRYASACFDQSCALSCPVNRDTYVERWLEESVHEIVRNIQEAPFLQYVFDSKGRLGRSQRQKISKDLLKNPDYWSPLRESLSKVDPDGVILVQKLEPGCPSTCCLAEAFQSATEDSEMVCPLQAEGAETNVWGVLVQARGVHTNACYLLKTTRVSSSVGICTRYCLTRAKCFGPSHIDQLEDAWLL